MSNLTSAGNVTVSSNMSVGGTSSLTGATTLLGALNTSSNIVQSGATSVTAGSAGVISNLLSYASGSASIYTTGVTAITVGRSACTLSTASPTTITGLLTANSISANAIVCSVPAAVTNLFTNAAATINMGNSAAGLTLNSSQLLMPNGGVVMSAAPALSVYLSGTSISMPASTYTLAKFNTIEYQVGSNYSTTTGLFTVPTGWGGYYAITGACNIQGTPDPTNSFALIFKNGVAYKKGQQIGATSDSGSVFSLVAKFSAGDTISIYAFSAGGSSLTIATGEDGTFLTITYLRG